MVEYSDIWWYMSYESEYNKDRVKVEEMYGTRNDVDGEFMMSFLGSYATFHVLILHVVSSLCNKEFYIWRDTHVLREIYKYGWYIDYWMENGLIRDVSV